MKTMMKYDLKPTEKAKVRKSANTKCWQECRATEVSNHIGGSVTILLRLKTHVYSTQQFHFWVYSILAHVHKELNFSNSKKQN